MVKISFLVPELGCSFCTSFAGHCFNAQFAGQDLVASHQFRGASGARPGLSCQVMVVSKDVRYWYFWVKAVMKYSLLKLWVHNMRTISTWASTMVGISPRTEQPKLGRCHLLVPDDIHTGFISYTPRNRVANANFHKLSAVTTTSSWRTRFQVHEGPSQ